MKIDLFSLSITVLVFGAMRLILVSDKRGKVEMRILALDFKRGKTEHTRGGKGTLFYTILDNQRANITHMNN